MSTNDSKSLRDRISNVVLDMPKSGIRDFFDIVSNMKDVISLGVGEPGFDTPWHIREATVFALEKGATGYTSNLGLPKLREEICSYLSKAHGLNYNAESEILITVGVSEALDLAIRALVNPGDEVLYHEPCYVSYAPVIQLAYGVPVPVETRFEDEFRLTREMLEKKVTPKTKVLMLNFPNNPTGASLTKEDVQDIAAFAVEHDLIVITDEIYGELTYEGSHHSIAAEPGMKERTIYLHGFSKAWAMTGFRLGYACAPAELTEAMMKIHQYTMLCASILSQEAALEALKQPSDDIQRMRSEYTKHRNYMLSSFREMGIQCCQPRGAFYMFPYIGDLGISSKDFALQLLDQEKTAVVPGTAFGANGEGFIRCSYATSLSEIKIAMERITRFIQALRDTQKTESATA